MSKSVYQINRWNTLKVDIEQDLAVGQTPNNNEKSISQIFLDDNLSFKDKVRVILLYILRNGPQKKEWYEAAENHAKVPENEQNMIRNLQLMDIDIYADENSKDKGTLKKRKVTTDNAYRRWNPLLKDLVNFCIEGTLNQNDFPILGGQQAQITADSTSKRYGLPKSDNGNKQSKKEARVIVFIMGGISYSECRVAYEVTKEKRNHEVIVGSSKIFTPEDFLNEVKKLTDPIPTEESTCVIDFEDQHSESQESRPNNNETTTCNFLNPILHSIEKRFSRLRKSLPAVHFSIQRPSRREHDRVPTEEPV